MQYTTLPNSKELTVTRHFGLNSNKGTKTLTGFFATFYARRTFGKLCSSQNWRLLPSDPWIDSPEAGAADIGQSRTESVAQESEKPKDDIAVGSRISHDLGRLQFGLLLEHQESPASRMEGSVIELICLAQKNSLPLHDALILRQVPHSFVCLSWEGQRSIFCVCHACLILCLASSE